MAAFGVFLAMLQLALGSLLGVRADIDPPGCKGSGLGISLFADRQVAHIGDVISYDVLVFNGAFPACLADELTASITTPDGVVHPIILRRLGLQPGQSDSYKSVVTYTVRTQDVQSDGTLKATGQTDGAIHQNVIDSSGNAFQSLNTVVALPCIDITHTCEGAVGENGLISIAGTVRNCGNIALTGITVTNYVNGQATRIKGPFVLNVGESVDFTTSYRGICGANTARLVASGQDVVPNGNPTQQTVSDESVSTCSISTTPVLKVGLECVGNPPVAGGRSGFAGSITNAGNVTLSNVTVVTDAGVKVFGPASLAPGARATFTGSVAVGTDQCSVPVSVTASGTDVCATFAVTDVASVVCPVTTTPGIAVTHDCPAGVLSPGATVSFTGAVRNTGNVTLNDVTVVNGGTIVFGPAVLAPNANATFTSSVTLPADSCSVTTQLSASGVDLCLARTVTGASTKTCPVGTAPAVLVSAECPTGELTPGGSALYTGVVSNSGNVTLNEVTVTTAGGARVFGPTSLAPGAAANFTATVTVPSSGCVLITAFTAKGKDKCTGTEVNNLTTKNCPITTGAELKVEVACVGTPPGPGGTAGFAGAIANAGNVTLTNVTVVSGGKTVFGPASLSPGARATFTGSVAVGADQCSVPVEVIAGGFDACSGVAVGDSASVVCPVTTTPGIAVTHDCPAGVLTPGTTVSFAGVVRNTGNVTLNDVTVMNGGTIVFGPAVLAPNANGTFTSSVALPADSCSVTTQLSASGVDLCLARTVTGASTKTCPVGTAPAVLVSAECPTGELTPGGSALYTGVVSNSGNVTLNEVTVTTTGGARVFGPASLAPGAVANFTATVTVPSSGCVLTSTFTATGKDKCTAAVVNNLTTKTCPITTGAGLKVGVACVGTPPVPGGTAGFAGAITNLGNVTLTNVTVVSGGKTIFGPASLTPGARATFTGTTEVPLDVCSVSVAVLATGFDTCSGLPIADSASVVCPVTTAPQLTTTLDCGPAVAPGKPMTFSGTVRNSGNVTLTDVFVRHSLAQFAVLGPVALAPGQSMEYSGSFVVPANNSGCFVATLVTATGNDICLARTASAQSSANCPVVTLPGILVTRTCPPGATAQGSRLEYTGIVSNTGNTTLTNIVVTDSVGLGGQVLPVFTAALLAPGQSANFTGSFIVPTNCCTISATLTATAMTSSTPSSPMGRKPAGFPPEPIDASPPQAPVGVHGPPIQGSPRALPGSRFPRSSQRSPPQHMRPPNAAPPCCWHYP